MARAPAHGQGTSVVVVGCGNIGSFLVDLLARDPHVGRMVLVDRDRYEAKNLASQRIFPADIGAPKAVAQAGRLRQIRPDVEVTACHEAVEQLPLGLFRVDVIAACLDSLRVRQIVSEISWRMGVPLVDAGVETEMLLARVSTFVPALDGPCLECSWSEEAYRSMEVEYPCGGREGVAPTNGTSGLGSLAASLQALECGRVIRGQFVCGEVVVDAAGTRMRRATGRRNASCRFDHETWEMGTISLNAHATLGDLVDAMDSANGCSPMLSMAVFGQRFITRALCPSCQREFATLRLTRPKPAALRCGRCGGPSVPAGFGISERIDLTGVPRRLRGLRLSTIGFRSLDVITTGEGGHRHVLQLC